MRAVVQRVTQASVETGGEVVGRIAHGLLVLIGVDESDELADTQYVVDKLSGLRIFNDAEGKFNLSVHDAGGAVLLISQFTLHGDCRRGRRPSFTKAARPEKAIPLYEAVAKLLREQGLHVEMGRFGAHMAVHLVNDGPVTVLLDSKRVF